MVPNEISLEGLIQLHIEALIFSCESPISKEEIWNCIQKTLPDSFNRGDLETLLFSIETKYLKEEFIFELVKIHKGYLFLTKKTYASTIQAHLTQKNPKKLSSSAMETLSIIVYKQPITKSEIEEIRGVNTDYAIQKLLERNLIEIAGKSQGPGRPLIYITSDLFMNYFKLDSLDELPQIKDLPQVEN